VARRARGHWGEGQSRKGCGTREEHAEAYVASAYDDPHVILGNSTLGKELDPAGGCRNYLTGNTALLVHFALFAPWRFLALAVPAHSA